MSEIKIEGITELLTPRKRWYALQAGDYVRSRVTRRKRKILRAHGGIIVLQKLRGEGTTVYVDCDRHFFVI